MADTFARTMLPHLQPTGAVRRGAPGKPAELFLLGAALNPKRYTERSRWRTSGPPIFSTTSGSATTMSRSVARDMPT